MTQDARKIARHRAERRPKAGETAYSLETYAARIRVHADTLDKYLSRFGGWLAIWVARTSWNRPIALGVFGIDRLEDILAGARPTCAEVLQLYKTVDLRDEFIEYVEHKTHFSYELAAAPTPRSGQKNDWHGPYYAKLAEFVHIIMAEYVVLHNYMWASGLRPASVHSIDRWLKKLPDQAPAQEREQRRKIRQVGRGR